MFGILTGLTKIALSPIKGVVKVIEDVSGENGEDQQGLSLFSLGLSSIVKGTAEGIKDGADDIFQK